MLRAVWLSLIAVQRFKFWHKVRTPTPSVSRGKFFSLHIGVPRMQSRLCHFSTCARFVAKGTLAILWPTVWVTFTGELRGSAFLLFNPVAACGAPLMQPINYTCRIYTHILYENKRGICLTIDLLIKVFDECSFCIWPKKPKVTNQDKSVAKYYFSGRAFGKNIPY